MLLLSGQADKARETFKQGNFLSDWTLGIGQKYFNILRLPAFPTRLSVHSFYLQMGQQQTRNACLESTF